MQGFGKWLLERRKAVGLTQGQLAARAGISTSYVSTLEREQGHTITNAPPRPAPDVVDGIAKALGADVNEARLAAGYAPTEAVTKPRNVPELIAALERLGIEPPLFYARDLPDPGNEAFEEVIERIWLDINLVLSRHSKGRKITERTLSIEDENKGENLGEVLLLKTK